MMGLTLLHPELEKLEFRARGYEAYEGLQARFHSVRYQPGLLSSLDNNLQTPFSYESTMRWGCPAVFARLFSFLSWSGLFFLWCRKKTVWQIVRRGSAPPVCVHFGPRSRFKERHTYAGWAVVGAVLVLHMCVSRCFSTYRVAKLKVSFYDRI